MKETAWQRTRKNHLATFPLCAVCEDDSDLVVHHLRYRGKRGESEISGDLVTLCRWHHDDLHHKHRLAKGSLVRFTIDYIHAETMLDTDH